MISSFTFILFTIIFQYCNFNGLIRGDILSPNKTLIYNITQILDSILFNHDRHFRPINEDPYLPLQVEIDISVRSIGPISEQKMEFSLDCYFRQKWLDRRLAFEMFDKTKDLPISNKMLKDIWKPDTYIRNGRHSYLHTLTVPNILFRVRYDGQIHISQRLTIQSRCEMFFKKFPMDYQACPIEIGSLGYFSKDIIYVWKNVELDIAMGDMLQIIYLLKKKKINFFFPFYISVLKVYFKLKRQQSFYILQIYTPCTLIVIVSWISFWINKESSPARVSLGIMTVLSVSTLGFSYRSDLPKISHSTALDIYIISCFGFVFAAVIEYAIINHVNTANIRKKNATNVVNRIDSASKIVFPSLYILFNIIYWLAFLYWIPDEINNLI
ncbi:unnamed protein product [Brugia pahangi]|uniref:Neur_chan_LBD domain-containing protein n=1 Tax=Brugia pahangi TaxID=6280 RepID=A0A158PRV6_BRUPA|nr:unnamed protein product [Brugia pahangi]